MERGINAPSFETIEKISNVLKVSYVTLFDFYGALDISLEQNRDTTEN